MNTRRDWEMRSGPEGCSQVLRGVVRPSGVWSGPEGCGQVLRGAVRS